MRFFILLYAYFRMLAELFNLLREPLSTGLGNGPQFSVFGIEGEYILVHYQTIVAIVFSSSQRWTSLPSYPIGVRG